MDAGKVIVITGASDGIGAAAARSLARAGHQVVLVGRSPEKTKRIAAELEADSRVADFADLSAVRLLAADLQAKYPRIDVLANNAGGVPPARTRQVTVDGHEIAFQVNYLAPFLLTNLLLDRLTESRATVISTSSVGHRMVSIDLANLDSEKRYRGVNAYNHAKLALILFTRELDRRYRSRGLTSAAFNPGNIASNFAQQPGDANAWIARSPLFRRLIGASPETGADTLSFLAQGRPGTDFPSGEYFVKRKATRASKQSYDSSLAAQLWDRSVAMTQP
ncbi:MAG TPA: SDR family NAD(P)-dependent oxidoreductase [Trebonia sp.]|nr:SDR family NAD(P)-dependent oxidoreductase [Trebonia sp.]